MSIQTQEEKLFEKWRTNRPRFVADGVVNESEYLASSPKLLFVLKEVNDATGGNWDLRKFLRDGGRSQTWDNISRWVEGIRANNEIPWKQLQNIDERRRENMLRTIAAINLKKSPGGQTTDKTLLARIAEEDKEFLNQQFSFYEPDIVVCCGTDVSNIFHNLIRFEKQPDWNMTTRGIWYHEFNQINYVIAFAHPEARVADYLLYYGLVDAIHEICKATT